MSRRHGCYRGFEQGPIRPPNEAHSLLIRVTRNCPWNRCTFCPVYKGTSFSLRPAEDVKRDIDAVHTQVVRLRAAADSTGRLSYAAVEKLAADVSADEAPAFAAAARWLLTGGRSIFLQDANSLAVRPAELCDILRHLRRRFFWVERITSYARSQTVAHRKPADLKAIREAGLDRLHIGFESGCDEVLRRVNKGCTSRMHIEAGLKAREAGFELSEYYMPGLGGRELSEAHALDSAAVLHRIDPDFIRIRTLAIPPDAPLFEQRRRGEFQPCSDELITRELHTFIANLHGIHSVIRSDHIVNLFGDLEGRLPDDRASLLAMLRAFLELPPERQLLYRVGRRLGLLCGLRDLDDPDRLATVDAQCRQLGITTENADELLDSLTQGFVSLGPVFRSGRNSRRPLAVLKRAARRATQRPS